MERQNQLLTVLAVLLLVGVAFIVLDPKKDEMKVDVPDGAPPQHALWDVKSEDVTKLTLTRAGEALAFEKVEGKWTMTAPRAIPIDERRVTEILDRFLSLKVEERDIAGNDADYGLDAAGQVEVAVETGTGGRHVAWVGKDATVGYRTYLREKEGGTIRLAASKVADLVQKSADDFRSRDLWTISSATARRVQLVSGSVTVVLRKDDHGWWLGDSGPRADDDAVRTWLYSVEGLRAEGFLDGVDAASVGLDSPVATVTVEDDGGTHSLAFGPPGDPAGRAARGEHGLVRLGPDTPDPVKVEGWLATKLLPVRRIQLDRVDILMGGRSGTFTRSEGTWKNAAGETTIAVEGLLDKVDAAGGDRTPTVERPASAWGHIRLGEGESRKEEVSFGPPDGGFHVAWDAAGGPPFQVPEADLAAIAAALPG